ncbi:hypothetical protein [Nocardioides sp. CER19]|uniref:hypothetical protein n=1 Tax=Nocardioides sp. CER19 TaxID=3038538 RepID=UPI002449A528|nr:hypothetical protein [Nocardioides sp. CER19]MDH2415027.1 hypothetical protein [Nocardioides sp. CER19]
MFLEIVALHMGALHPYEKVLTLLLAFGPFVVLGLVIAVRRRQDLAEERAEEVAAEQELSGRATPGRPGSPS